MPNSPAEQRAVFALLLHAALADGSKSDAERSALRQMTESFGGGPFNPWTVYNEVLGGRYSVDAACADLPSHELRLLAYEMALGVCDTDGPANPAEQAFLQRLRAALRLDGAETGGLDRAADELARAVRLPAADSPAATSAVSAAAAATAYAASRSATAAEPPPFPTPSTATTSNSAPAVPPVAPASAGAPPRLVPVDTAALEKSVLNHAILTAALELLPQSLATMAVVPLQMKLVYGIGKAHGYTLDRGHIRDFLATAGAGFAAQAVEGYARKLLGGLVGGALGKGMIGGLGRAAVGTGAGAAITFAATYAIGQLAIRYYAGGRRMETTVLRDTYQKLLADGRRLFGAHQGDIERRAATLSPGEIVNLVRQP